MGMFTKLFSKSHDPYDLKGRWYKIRASFDPDEQSVSIISADIPQGSQEEEPTSLSFMINYSGNYYQLFVAYGVISNFFVIPIDGQYQSANDSIIAKKEEGSFSTSVLMLHNVKYDVDIYLYIVRG